MRWERLAVRVGLVSMLSGWLLAGPVRAHPVVVRLDIPSDVAGGTLTWRELKQGAAGGHGPWNTVGKVSTLPETLRLEDAREYQIQVEYQDWFTITSAHANVTLVPNATYGEYRMEVQPPTTNWARVLEWVVLPVLAASGLGMVRLIRQLRGVRERAEDELRASKQLASTVMGRWDPQGEALLPTDMRVGRYRIVGKLGAGGMAAVYRVIDDVGGAYALKIPHLDSISNNDTLGRFEREINICVGLSHPNVVRTFDAGTYQTGQGATVPFMVMEIINGSLVDEIMRLRRQAGAEPDLEGARHIIRGTLEGLAFAHERGITHRDIKPSNVMLTDKGTIKVMDFGIAHMSSARTLTPTGYVLGTPAYMSPEQLGGSPFFDERSDLYAVGVMLYELLTYQLPFAPSPTDPLAGLLGKLHGSPDPPRTHNPNIPQDLNDLTMSLLEGAMDTRCPSAREALARLDGLQGPATENFHLPGWRPPDHETP